MEDFQGVSLQHIFQKVNFLGIFAEFSDKFLNSYRKKFSARKNFYAWAYKWSKVIFPEFSAKFLILKIGLGLIHQGGVMHQQLIPRHILVNRNTADIRYIDFSLASVLSKQLASAVYVRKFAGHYEWISPGEFSVKFRPLGSIFRTGLYGVMS